MDSSSLRRVMTPPVWDSLAHVMPESLVDAYDTIVEVMYGGDWTPTDSDPHNGSANTERAKAGDRLVHSPFPLHPGVIRDSRLVPMKKATDAKLVRAAKALTNGRPHGHIEKNLQRLAERLWWQLHELNIVPLGTLR